MGKPGWIAEDCIGGSVVFNMSFGLHPLLIVTALTSYGPQWGAVAISIALLPRWSDVPHNASFPSRNRPLNETLEAFSFTLIGKISARRTADEWEQASLTTGFVFRSASDSSHTYHFPRSLAKALVNCHALVKLTQVDAKDVIKVDRKKLDAAVDLTAANTSTAATKFKLIGLNSC